MYDKEQQKVKTKSNSKPYTKLCLSNPSNLRTEDCHVIFLYFVVVIELVSNHVSSSLGAETNGAVHKLREKGYLVMTTTANLCNCGLGYVIEHFYKLISI